MLDEAVAKLSPKQALGLNVDAEALQAELAEEIKARQG
jgi:hypothetical protein